MSALAARMEYLKESRDTHNGMGCSVPCLGESNEDNPPVRKGKYHGAGMCVHCGVRKVGRPRGMCLRCYDDRDIRVRYPSRSRYGKWCYWEGAELDLEQEQEGKVRCCRSRYDNLVECRINSGDQGGPDTEVDEDDLDDVDDSDRKLLGGSWESEVVKAPPLPPMPTDALPGTVEKIRVMMKRYAAGYALWHPQDARRDRK